MALPNSLNFSFFSTNRSGWFRPSSRQAEDYCKWFAKAPMIAGLPISGLIMGHAKDPAANIFLRPAGGQVPVQAKKSILNGILGFVAREPETNQVSK